MSPARVQIEAAVLAYTDASGTCPGTTNSSAVRTNISPSTGSCTANFNETVTN